MSNDDSLTIKGRILLIFCHELAYAVNVDQLEKLLKKQETQEQISLRRSKSHYLKFESYPLLIDLGTVDVEIEGGRQTVKVQARIFDFGVASIRFILDFSGGINDLIGRSALLSESEAFVKLSRRQLDRVRAMVRKALIRPIKSALVEDYAIFQITELSGSLTGRELLEQNRSGIAMILRAEESELSEYEVNATIAQTVSYYPDDILIVDWERAFLYDREEHTDHIDIMEFANTQLLDMRYYDGFLDRELLQLYRDIQVEGIRIPVIRIARYRQLSRRIMLLLTDVTWLSEQIGNYLKAVDTLYAARVYRAIGQKLYLNEWKDAIDKKLTTLRDISSDLNMRIYNLRSVILEFTIVVLILAEIVILFFI